MKSVVGAAILRHGRVLAARRTFPASAAGRWEFPGGKVEPGETPEHALAREVAEELGCRIRVTGWLAGQASIGDTHVLTVATAALVEGDPHPHEHDLVRWLAADELGDVDWLEPDRPFLAQLRGLLTTAPSARLGEVRGIFFEEDAARAVARQLVSDGYDARVERERLAGEDDDEDHPWAVLTDARGFQLELLVDQYDGWLDTEGDEPSRPAPPPIDLPSHPRRLKRPER